MVNLEKSTFFIFKIFRQARIFYLIAMPIRDRFQLILHYYDKGFLEIFWYDPADWEVPECYPAVREECELAEYPDHPVSTQPGTVSGNHWQGAVIF